VFEDGPLFILLHDRQLTHLKQRRLALSFLLRQWWKATKTTRIAGPLFLAKNAMPEGSWQSGWCFLMLKS